MILFFRSFMLVILLKGKKKNCNCSIFVTTLPLDNNFFLLFFSFLFILIRLTGYSQSEIIGQVNFQGF